MTERFWFLSQLFVRPQTQAKGVGQALLSKTLMQAQRNGATNRALITPAYNITSTGLYLNHGLYPREPLYRMAAPAQRSLSAHELEERARAWQPWRGYAVMHLWCAAAAHAADAAPAGSRGATAGGELAAQRGRCA